MKFGRHGDQIGISVAQVVGGRRRNFGPHPFFRPTPLLPSRGKAIVVLYLISYETTMLTIARRRILESLLQAPDEWVPLTRLARMVGLAHPTVLAHLGTLQQQGLVQTLDSGTWGRGIRYRPSPATHHVWCDPARKVLAEWSSSGTMDWRFPLVSRVPDLPAQRFLYEWLDRSLARGLLPAHRSRFEKQVPQPPSMRVVVYGSCARGPAPPKSDIDILVLGLRNARVRTQILDVAHEVALTAERSPDIRAPDEKAWRDSLPSFQREIRRDGKTVFTNDFEAPLVERTVGHSHE